MDGFGQHAAGIRVRSRRQLRQRDAEIGDERVENRLRGRAVVGHVLVSWTARRSGSVIFISVTGPYFAAASRIFAASPTSTMARSAGRGNASAVTAAASASIHFRHRRRIPFDVVLAEPVELQVRERGGPVRGGLELQRILAEHVGTRRFEHLGGQRIALQVVESLQREIQCLRGGLGLREGADQEGSRHAAAQEGRSSAVRESGLDAQLGVQNGGEAPAVQRVHQVERRASAVALVHADVAQPEIGLHRARGIDQQHAPAADARRSLELGLLWPWTWPSLRRPCSMPASSTSHRDRRRTPAWRGRRRNCRRARPPRRRA